MRNYDYGRWHGWAAVPPSLLRDGWGDARPEEAPVLPVRAKNVLQRLGVGSAVELARLTEAEVISVFGCGQTTLWHLRKWLKGSGLRFRKPGEPVDGAGA